MKKNQCLGFLTTVRSSYAISLLSSYLISEADDTMIPVSLEIQNQQNLEEAITFDISQLKQLLTIEQNKIQLVTEFSKSSIRTFIHNTYELVLDYAKSTRQEPSFYGSELIIFTRLLRNNVGHDHRFRFTNKDKERLRNKPVKWRDKEITLEMEGKSIPMELMDHGHTTILFDDIVNFLIDQLK
ncbi:MAG: hypothetical protein ACTSU7_01240 [Candidatus Heimdallarchaeaceae archaeon]